MGEGLLFSHKTAFCTAPARAVGGRAARANVADAVLCSLRSLTTPSAAIHHNIAVKSVLIPASTGACVAVKWMHLVSTSSR